MRRLTADPESELHVSIAGGRKTMGYYLGYALSLFGREQDRLSHVLVSPPYESHPDFFYPSRSERIIYSLDNRQRPLDCRAAEVTLAHIPFVRLRHGLDPQLLAGHSQFSQAVASAQKKLQPPSLRIDLENKKLQAAGQEITLRPRELAFYSLFARRARTGQPAITAPPKEVGDAKWANRFLAEYKKIRSHTADDTERTEKALAQGMDGDYFSQCKSRVHSTLKKALGPIAAAPYLIDNGGKRPGHYRLNLPPEAIHFNDHKGSRACQKNTKQEKSHEK